MHQRKKEINCESIGGSINFKTRNHAQHPSNQTKFPRHFGNFHPTYTYRACGFPLLSLFVRGSNLFRSIHPCLKGLNPKQGKWIKRCAVSKEQGAYISRRSPRWYRRDSTRGFIEGRAHKRNGNVSRYFLPRFFLSLADALRTELGRIMAAKETRCPARIYFTKPLAPIYIRSGWSVRNDWANIFLVRRGKRWCYCDEARLPLCGKRVGWSG